MLKNNLIFSQIQKKELKEKWLNILSSAMPSKSSKSKNKEPMFKLPDPVCDTTKLEKSVLPSGEPNPKYIDVLRMSKQRPGQSFVAVSFIDPGDILKRREMYLFEKFVQQWGVYKCIEKSSAFINFISHKYKLDTESVMKDFSEFVKEEEETLKDMSFNLECDFKNFLDNREKELTDKFQKEHNFQTSERAVKIYGTFATEEELNKYVKEEIDEDDIVNIHSAPTGAWLYWNPDPYKTANVVYQEEQLNTLYQEKIKNAKKKDEEFNKRKEAMRRKAIEDNIARARETGGTITQTIDEEGNIVGVLESGKLDFDMRVAREKGDEANILPQSLRNESV